MLTIRINLYIHRYIHVNILAVGLVLYFMKDVGFFNRTQGRGSYGGELQLVIRLEIVVVNQKEQELEAHLP